LDKFSEETEGFSGSDIEQACIDALRKAIVDGKDYIELSKLKEAILGQKDKIEAKRQTKP